MSAFLLVDRLEVACHIGPSTNRSDDLFEGVTRLLLENLQQRIVFVTCAAAINKAIHQQESTHNQLWIACNLMTNHILPETLMLLAGDWKFLNFIDYCLPASDER